MKRTLAPIALVVMSSALAGCASNDLQQRVDTLSNKVDQLSTKVDQLATGQAAVKQAADDAKAAADSAAMEAKRANERIDNMSTHYYKK
ncbi:Lpp/OprI family alanine-zipper lipoprotein [Gallaecimonas sp. GXIMD1310]|uniref:Lpp/OprI family alanine-zipper lipoprotein n=1 Tax=Gallaecimonas sp. GXIMD1310 TaxID=3131926 RepID=UPI00324F2497